MENMELVVCEECGSLFFKKTHLDSNVCMTCFVQKELKLKKKILDKQRTNFNIKFQEWSNKQFFDDGSPLGKCGYGYICDYCEDNTWGNPCARALAKCAKDEGVDFDYSREDYETIFCYGAKMDEEVENDL